VKIETRKDITVFLIMSEAELRIILDYVIYCAETNPTIHGESKKAIDDFINLASRRI